MIKYLILGVIFYLIYVFFFKSRTLSNPKTRDKKDDSVDTVFECYRCNTYVSIKEAMLMDGKYFCSKECVDDYTRSWRS